MRHSDYALDLAASRIASPRSKDLFREPLECFLNGAYRLAVVGLWTVVVFDLLEKVGEMADLYKDPVAQALIEDVENERKKAEAAKSPRWEPWLLEQVATRTQLLEPADKLNLDHLFALRNLCAHPILQHHSPELQNVRPETARACFVHALEGLLTKPALLTGQVASRLLEDLASRNWDAVKPEEFERYFEARYLGRLSGAASLQLFRRLWKLAFKVDSAEAENARDELRQLIDIVYSKDPAGFDKVVESDGAFFGNVVPVGSRGETLHRFLSRRHGLYGRLPEPTKADLDEYLRNAPARIRMSSSYKHPDLRSFIRSLEQDIKTGKLTQEALGLLPELSPGSEEFGLLAQIATEAWHKSPSFPRSGNLSPVIDYVIARSSRDQLEALMVASNENDQVYKCGLAAPTCKMLLKEVRRQADDLADAERFPNLELEIDATAP